MSDILSVNDLDGNERWRMIKSRDILERVINYWPITDPATFEPFVYFGRDRLNFEEVIDAQWPWIHWCESDLEIIRKRHTPERVKHAEESFARPKITL